MLQAQFDWICLWMAVESNLDATTFSFSINYTLTLHPSIATINKFGKAFEATDHDFVRKFI